MCKEQDAFRACPGPGNCSMAMMQAGLRVGQYLGPLACLQAAVRVDPDAVSVVRLAQGGQEGLQLVDHELHTGYHWRVHIIHACMTTAVSLMTAFALPATLSLEQLARLAVITGCSAGCICLALLQHE